MDIPSCSTACLDKPIRNHTLVQTIALANRVFSSKQSGCGPGKGGTTPVKDWQGPGRRAAQAARSQLKQSI